MTALTRLAFSGAPHLVPQGWAIWLEMVMANVTELRVVLAVNWRWVKESGLALAFYRDVLGFGQVAGWGSGDGRAVALDAGRAGLERFDDARAGAVDAIEAGCRVSGAVRLAVRVAGVTAGPGRGRAIGRGGYWHLRA